MESLIPLRGLSLHARLTCATSSRRAVERAAGIFLARRLHRKRSDGRLMKGEFAKLHYPSYWKYDILFGLKVMAEAGFISDPRCDEALELLEAKRLPDGGFPAERKLFKAAAERRHGISLVDWGGIGRSRSNPFVTADALSVLEASGR